MSQTLVEPVLRDVDDLLDFSGDEGSDGSADGSPAHIDSHQDEEVKEDIAPSQDCKSAGKSSSGVSENSFSSGEHELPQETSMLQKLPPTATTTSVHHDPLNESNLNEDVLLAGDDFLGLFDIDSDEEERLLSDTPEKTKDISADDLGFIDFSPLKRERSPTNDRLSDCSAHLSAKRARVETTEEPPPAIEQPRQGDASSDDLSGGELSPFSVSNIVKDDPMQPDLVAREEIVGTSSPMKVMNEVEEDDSFDVNGVKWNFSSRCSEYLTSSEYINDIYKVIVSRELGSSEDVWNEKYADLDESLRSDFIERLLQEKDHLNLSLTTVHLSIRLLDLFIISHSCENDLFIGVCVVAVVLASKMEEYDSGRFSHVCNLLFPDASLTDKTMNYLERSFFSCFNFDIDVPTAFLISNILHTAVISTKQQVHLANYLLELSITEWSMGRHRPTDLANAIVALSHAVVKDNDHTGRSLSEVETLFHVERRLSDFNGTPPSRPIVSELIDLHEKASTNHVSIYDRYSTENELYVALFGISNTLKEVVTEEEDDNDDWLV